MKPLGCIRTLVVGLLAAHGAIAASPEGASTPLGKLNFSVNFDAYYAHFFNGVSAYTGLLPEDAPPGVSGAMRKFDVYSQQFSINLVELAGSIEGKEADFRFALNFGESANLIHQARTGREIDALSKYVGQAYATYHPSAVSGLSFSFGKIPTQMSAEDFHSQSNANYSRSFLYSLGMPYWYTGLRVSYLVVPGMLLVAANVGDGWNSFFTPNGARSVGARVGLMPMPGLQIYYNGAFGSQAVGLNDFGRTVHEFNLTYTSGDEFRVTADVLLGKGSRERLADGTIGEASWKSGWLGVRIGFPGFFLAPRIEFFRDSGGAQTRTDQMIYAETVTAGILFGDGLEGRLEFRHDQSDHEVFTNREGFLFSGQNSLAAAILYSF